MGVVWGLVIAVLALVCWGGQALALFAPTTAERFGLADLEAEVDPVFYADGRGEALWDTATLWTLLVAGVLLMFDSDAWPYFGLGGGAMYVYFAGRGIFARRAMQRMGQRIGSVASVKTALAALTIWGMAGMITVIAAIVALAD
jgi:hypothetical protein